MTSWKGLHNPFEPANVVIIEGKRIEEFYLKGRRHNDFGPAYIRYDHQGNVELEEYYLNGICHRIDGPAKVWYSNKKIICEVFYEFGQIISIKRYDLKIKYEKKEM